MKAFSKLLRQPKPFGNRSAQSLVMKGEISPDRAVPSHIERPTYAEFGNRDEDEVYIFKDPDEIHRMKESGHLARRMLDYALSLAAPGVTTDHIDSKVHEEIIRHGAYPSPLHYSGFPKSICTSVNEVACHGIPDSRPLQEGDMLKIDVSLFLKGFHGDNCGCVMVGDDAVDSTGLMKATHDALEKAISICGPGVCLTEIGATIQGHAEGNKFDVVSRFCGHGLGRILHMAPTVLHCRNRYKMPLLPGMIFTIEPILAEGSGDVDLWSDGWTVATSDNSWCSQYEHEVLITDHGYEVLTRQG